MIYVATSEEIEIYVATSEDIEARRKIFIRNASPLAFSITS
jgi:hypothetical protein